MKIADITRYLEELAPLAYQEEYDNCGLLIGDGQADLTKALLCLDVDAGVMDEAVSLGCNLVIAHHPFIFKGLKKLVPGRIETRVIETAIRHGIAVYAMHTNLDNRLEGLNALLLSRLGVVRHRILRPMENLLSKLVVFCPHARAGAVRDAMFAAGAGVIGNYDSCSFNLAGDGTFRALEGANPFVGEKNSLHSEPETRIEVILPRHGADRVVAAMLAAHPYEEVAYDLYPLSNRHARVGAGLIGELDEPVGEREFLGRVREELRVPVIRHSAWTGRPVSSVAVCSGSGAFLVADALRAGAGVYLTADLKYHDFSGFGNRMLLADIGHYESEIWVKEWLHAALIEKFPTFAFLISESGTNPVNYF
jgi:dinuclear metal center YbgI/SA1388 family protein